MASTEVKLKEFAPVDIDPEGVFKYVLIEVTAENDKGEEVTKLLVRGYKRANFHADVYDEVEEKIRAVGLDAQCLGGGRIQHDASAKKIKVYGYSMGFGKADHSKTVEELKKVYPDYNIEWSNDGY